MPNYALKSMMEWWARQHAQIGLTHALSALVIKRERVVGGTG